MSPCRTLWTRAFAMCFVRRGIHRLYCHQAGASAWLGRSATLWWSPHRQRKDPVLQSAVVSLILKNNDARACASFPQGALGRSGQPSLSEHDRGLGGGHQNLYLRRRYPGRRVKTIREAEPAVVTPADMLHQRPPHHHTRWVKLFENPRIHRHRRAAHLPRRIPEAI